MRTSAAARRYARALFSLARDEGELGEVREQLDGLYQLLRRERALREALLTPRFPAEQRKRVITALAERAGLARVLHYFLLFLVDQRRIVAFDAIHDEFERLADEASGLVTASVVAASELDERRQDRLRRALSDRTGREVRLDIRVDPELIGGAIARVGDTVFDGSIRTQLERLRATLTKGS